MRHPRNNNIPLPAILKRAQLLAALLAFLVVCPPAALTQSSVSPTSNQTLSLPEYVSELDRCSAVLKNSAANSAVLHELRASLPLNWNVTSGEAHYSVATAWLSGALDQIEKNPGTSNDLIAQTQQRLKTYRQEALGLESSNSSQTLAQSRKRLNMILSAREFQGQRGPSWLDVLKARFWSWLGHLFERIFGRVGSKKIGNVVAWGVVLLACSLLLFWALRYLIRAGARSELNLRDAAPVHRDWHRWLREAREAAARGEYRAAIHAAYWAAIVRMEETQFLPEDRSRTPRESLRLIKRESAEYAPLLQLTRRFELVWYGYRSATAADWTDAVQQLETLGCLRSSTPAI